MNNNNDIYVQMDKITAILIILFYLVFQYI